MPRHLQVERDDVIAKPTIERHVVILVFASYRGEPGKIVAVTHATSLGSARPLRSAISTSVSAYKRNRMRSEHEMPAKRGGVNAWVRR